MGRIGIRREDKNAWERRVPLTPDHVAELVDNHEIEISVQPSETRAFPDQDYRTAGARIDDDLAGCAVVLGVKEVPIDKLVAGRTYVYFSHTTKAQGYNMPMLRRLLELGCSLVDYEHVLDGRGRRLIFFGRHAGYAGMIDGLWALGRRLAHEGRSTPLERIRLAHDYSSLDEATHHVSRIGERLRHTGLPEGVGPIVCGFTGSGNVSLGAQEIFDRLPIVEVDPDRLEATLRDARRPRNLLYKVVFEREHRFRRIDGGPVEPQELSEHPERYTGGLDRWLEHLTMLVHGAFWTPRQPRVISIANLERLWAASSQPRLRVICDISCDIGGGIEATVRLTTPDRPVFVYDLGRREAVEGVAGDGPVVLAVDNLPCQLPVESSDHFGDTLIRFVPEMAACDWSRPLDALEVPQEIHRAIVVHRGELTPRYAYLQPHVTGPE